MQDAKVWLLSAALGFSACGGQGVTDQSPRRSKTPTPKPSDEVPYNVMPPNANAAGSGGQSGKGGASASGGGAGLASGGAGAGGMGISTGGVAGGSSGSSGVAGDGSVAPPDCPSLTRARLANGQCVDRISEFSVATNPMNIAIDSGKRLWFDDGTGKRIVQMDDQGRVLNQIAIDSASESHELVTGTGGMILWYDDFFAKTVTGISPDLKRTVFPLKFSPSGLGLGEGGELWLTEADKAVHRFEPRDSSDKTWAARPVSGIVVGPDENMWFAQSSSIGRLTVAGVREDFPITDGVADDVCAGPDGALWYTDGWLDQIGHMTVEGKLIRTWDLPKSSQPVRIIVGPDAALWFTEQGTGKIGRITVEGVVTHYPPPTSVSGPYGITVGPDHNIWFTERWSGKIGRLIPDLVE
jgi:virginiamycin B lyase